MAGLVALGSVIEKLTKAKTFVILAGVREPVRAALERAGVGNHAGLLQICATGEAALSAAREHSRANGGGAATRG